MISTRLGDLLSSFREKNTLEEQEKLLGDLLEGIGFNSYLYAVIPVSQAGDINEFLACTNFDKDWLSFYGKHDLLSHDYAADHCMNNVTPVKWNDMFADIDSGVIDRHYKSTADLTRDWGLSNGLSMPVLNSGPAKAVLSVTGNKNLSSTEFAKIVCESEKKLSLIADVFHMAVNRGAISQRYYRIASREIEVLKWLSDGCTAKQIAHKTGRSIHTINKQILSARARLGCATTVQAVAKAMMLGII